MKIECYHRCRKEDLSEPIQFELLDGGFILKGDMACDGLVPLEEKAINGQDITCVGPNHPNCPYLNEAKIA